MAVARGLFVAGENETSGTSPVEARIALAGLLTQSGDLGVTAGALSGGTVSGKSAWAYSVAAGHFVTTRGGTDGAVLLATDGATDTPTVAAAPGTGSRWDLIWIRHRDVDNADPDSNAVLGVTSGTSSGSPAKPYASVPAGALVLAEAQVGAGATGTLHANVVITQVAPRVAARGGVIPVRNVTQRDLLTIAGTPDNPLYVHRKDAPTGRRLEVCDDGATWRAVNSGPSWVLRDADGNAAPAGTVPKVQAFVVQDVANGSGALSVPFPEAFTVKPIVTATTASGAAIAPVINANSVTTTGVALIWPGNAGANIRVHVQAIGW